MPRTDHIELRGKVTDTLGGGQYAIQITMLADGKPPITPTTVRAQLSGRMQRNHIRVMVGDSVRVAVSPYDLTHGFIVFREK